MSQRTNERGRRIELHHLSIVGKKLENSKGVSTVLL